MNVMLLINMTYYLDIHLLLYLLYSLFLNILRYYFSKTWITKCMPHSFFFFFLPFAKIILNIKEENFMYFLYCLPIKFISNTNLRACNLESK